MQTCRHAFAFIPWWNIIFGTWFEGYVSGVTLTSNLLYPALPRWKVWEQHYIHSTPHVIHIPFTCQKMFQTPCKIYKCLLHLFSAVPDILWHRVVDYCDSALDCVTNIWMWWHLFVQSCYNQNSSVHKYLLTTVILTTQIFNGTFTNFMNFFRLHVGAHKTDHLHYKVIMHKLGNTSFMRSCELYITTENSLGKNTRCIISP